MIFLRPFSYKDCDWLRKNYLRGYAEADVIRTIEQWETKRYKGYSFEMYAIKHYTVTVGTISMRLHDDRNTVSLQPEILPKFRRKGYAKAAMQQLIELLRTHEYWHLYAQIRKDNIAGIALHESLGYKFRSETVNRNGSEVLIYTLDM